jgi:hypothetical protein
MYFKLIYAIVKQHIKLFSVISFGLLLLLSFVLVEYFKPTYNKLIESNWCVEKVYSNNTYYYPHTTDIFKIIPVGHCFEEIQFLDDGNIILPGFNTNYVTGRWQLDNSKLIVDSINEFKNLFEGSFAIEFINDQLILTSDNSILYCHKEKS